MTPDPTSELEDATRPLPQTEALLQQAARNRVFPGCVYAAYAAGQVRAHGAVGSFRYEADAPPVLLDTRYDAASLTKVLAATAVAMLLYDMGRLPLDEPIMHWLGAFADAADPRRSTVTVRMLLDHSSGLPGYGRLFETAHDRSGIFDLAVKQPLVAAPGTHAEYSDIGFILLTAILEHLCEEPLDSFCQRHIFAPLSMSATGFRPAPNTRVLIPPTEDDREFRRRVIQGEVHDENCWVMGGVSGHAGLFTTALDALRFAACILDGGHTVARKQLFQPATIDLFATRQCHPHDSTRALGWDTPSFPSSSGTRFSARSIGHLGFTGTSLWIDREAAVAAVLLTNRTWPDRSNQAIRELRPRFHDALRMELGV